MYILLSNHSLNLPSAVPTLNFPSLKYAVAFSGLLPSYYNDSFSSRSFPPSFPSAAFPGHSIMRAAAAANILPGLYISLK